MKPIKYCYGCGLQIDTGKHYHDTAPAGSLLSSTCRELNTAAQARQRNAVKVNQGAALNGGKTLGKWNKSLATRLAPLVIRSHADVGRILGITAEASRLIELRALAKIRAALLPFRGATSGANKVTQITKPIPSLAD